MDICGFRGLKRGPLAAEDGVEKVEVVPGGVPKESQEIFQGVLMGFGLYSKGVWGLNKDIFGGNGALKCSKRSFKGSNTNGFNSVPIAFQWGSGRFQKQQFLQKESSLSWLSEGIQVQK